MSALDLMPLFNRALEALRTGRDIATTMQILGDHGTPDRAAIVGATAEIRQRHAYAVGQFAAGPRTAIIVSLAELPRTAQLALAGRYAEHTPALVVAAMERDRKPRCIAQPYEVENGRRVVDDRLGGHIVLTAPPEIVALLGRFWDGVEEREKVDARPRVAPGRGRFRR